MDPAVEVLTFALAFLAFAISLAAIFRPSTPSAVYRTYSYSLPRNFDRIKICRRCGVLQVPRLAHRFACSQCGSIELGPLDERR